ncbi:MAG TPA: peptidylprolyl isomerase [Thermodesulfobacteriota bacterium]|nr:peptidylprolyl isomerase [Thermodesulfobacteriota bacterium]
MKYIVVIAAAVLLAGCSDFNKFFESRREVPTEKEAGPEVIALVGGDEITKAELMRALERMPYKQKKLYQSSPEKLGEFLDIYINQKILYAEAVKRGIDKREDVIEKTENFKKQLVGKTFGQEVLKSIRVSGSEIDDYYRRHKEDYEQINVSEIYIKADPGNGTTKEAALARAREAYEKAKAGGDWDELVKLYSDDETTREKGGGRGYVQRGEFGPVIDGQIFGMKKGEITGPLEVSGGYFIIKINEGAAPIPEGQLKRRVESQIINEKLVEYVNGLRNEARVEVYRDRLEESLTSE